MARCPTATLSDLELTLDRAGDLILRPLHRALWRHAVHHLGDHVRHHVVVVDPLYGVARLGRPPARVAELRFLRQHRELRIARPDRMVREMAQRRMVEGVGGHDPGVVVLLLEQELDELLRELDVLAELPDGHAEDGRRRVRAGGAGGAVVMGDVGRGWDLFLYGGGVWGGGGVDTGALFRWGGGG